MTQAQRAQAIKKHLAGKNPSAIAKAIGFHRQTISNLIARYKKIGDQCFLSKPNSGRPKSPTITKKHKTFLSKTLPLKSPAQMHIENGGKEKAKWTAKDVHQLLHDHFGHNINLPECTVAIMDAGLTPISHTQSPSKLPIYFNWQEKLSQEFLDWRQHKQPASLNQRESVTIKKSKKRLATTHLGAPHLKNRIWTTPKATYHLHDTMLDQPNKLAAYFTKLATQH